MADLKSIGSTLDSLRDWKHHCRNQLSNINLAVEQIKSEKDDSDDIRLLCLDIINQSCIKIESLLEELKS
ncbi:MAG: hypothetical protein ACOH2A_02770 [Sphingobacteriaceae bacterium]